MKKLTPEFIGWFHGFLDGDGYLGHTRNTKFIKWEINFNLSNRDKDLLYLMKESLNIGNISELKTQKDIKRYRISSAKEIKNKILPIIDKDNLFTKHIYWQFKQAHILIENNIKLFDEKPLLDMDADIPNLTKERILQNPNFHNWLIGFFEAELAFYVSGNRAGWSVTQTNNPLVLEAIKEYMNVNAKILIDHRNGTNQRLSSESIKDVQKKINIISSSNKAKLLGYKKLQYNKWCFNLSNIPKYKNLNIQYL
uniref:Orf252 n=1 Tax=Rhizophydium sp. 136 TaxID=60187 RepID=Q950P9_9FUNG|nr:orf252 [Rhizophydium sp. 136]AAK84259.1 orf252 [Rhizophydium sp. 136]